MKEKKGREEKDRRRRKDEKKKIGERRGKEKSKWRITMEERRQSNKAGE